jgi:hypothetical protein
MAVVPSVVDLNASNPFRPVDWRHRLAVDRVASGRAFPRRTWDAATLEIASYLGRAGRAVDPRRLAAEFPSFHLAYGIYRDADPGLRYALEARLLTRGEAADIADSLGTDAAVVTSYQAAFFDVGDRRGKIDFIMRRVIDPPANEAYQFRNSGWKLLGYLGGVEALERVFHPDRQNGFDSVMSAERDATALALTGRMHWLVEHKSELDPRLVIRWPEIIGLIRKDGNSVRTDYERNVEQFLMSMPMQILEKSDVLNDPELQKAFELRASEQLLQAEGLPVPGLEFVEELERKFAGAQKQNPPAAKAADLPPSEQAYDEDPFS